MTASNPALHAVPEVMKKLVALCKNRGFVFQSSEIYGGLKSAYDYGPLGAELKRNLMGEWWKDMVTTRENVVGIDASIIMHPNVWRASGHAAGFADPLVDCQVSKERFRADKAPRPTVPGPLPITCVDKGIAKTYAEIIEKNFGHALERDGNVLNGLYGINPDFFMFYPKDLPLEEALTLGNKAAQNYALYILSTDAADRKVWVYPWRGYVSPLIGCPFLTAEKQFNLMFRTPLGAVDPMQDVAEVTAKLTLEPDLAIAIKAHFGKAAESGALAKAIESGERAKMLRAVAEQVTNTAMVYLRPETAQAMFVQFKNVMNSMSLKPPFGIAQMGKSFRNEVTVEHFIFRSCEFEQMEMEFFCEPGEQGKWMDYWKEQRMAWWQRYANYPTKFKFRPHEKDELAHYADQCFDVEYEYPWGWGELEGIASRTDHDLHAHMEASGEDLRYIDAEAADPKTGQKPWRYLPYVIEPAAGATRALLCFLLDAYHEEERTDKDGKPVTRTVLKLHPKLAPIKCAVLPLMKKDGLPEKAREIIAALLKAGINAKYDDKGAIGKRYAKHDEIGTPYCITIDYDSLTDGQVTIRDRDTTEQVRIAIAQAVEQVRARIEG